MAKPILIFGCGNPSRGDDALGVLLLDYVENACKAETIETISDFQLQVEHALDLANRELVLFADASVACADGFDFCELAPVRDNSYTSHAMSPAAVLAVYQEIEKSVPPPCFLLSIKGESFELGEGLSANAREHLGQACRFTRRLLNQVEVNKWRELARHA